MALQAGALTTVQRVADFMGLGTIASGSTKETILQVAINSATKWIENYIGFSVKQATYTNEEYDTEYGDSLILKRRPVSNVILQRRNSGMNEDDWETVDSSYYHVDEENGIIFGANNNFSPSRRGYRVTYTAGFNFDNVTTFLSDTDGADLEMACWMLVSSIYTRGKGGGGIQSESIGDYRVTYKGSLMENEDVTAILDAYADIGQGSYLTPSHY